MIKSYKLTLTSLLFFLSLTLIGQRRSSTPFISGDTFRFELANHYYDELTQNINPAMVKSGDIIFVKTEMLDSYLERIHPYISNKYILISHNSDHGITEKYIPYLNDEKIIVWFSQNILIEHPKLKPIPIGMANYCWEHGKIEPMQIAQKRKPLFENRSSNIYMNFCPKTYPIVRNVVMDLFKDKPFVSVANVKGIFEYLTEMMNYKYVISPRGNGIDCHRTWEALLMGCIPIVFKSTLDPLYEDLPVIIVDAWEQITPDFLKEKTKELFTKKFNMEKIYFEYWKKEILQYKNL